LREALLKTSSAIRVARGLTLLDSRHGWSLLNSRSSRRDSDRSRADSFSFSVRISLVI
jgi:hypothetical protein